MTETTETPTAGGTAGSARTRGGGLSSKLLPELRQIASGLGIKTNGKKKADLVAAIRAAQSGAGSSGSGSRRPEGQSPKQADTDRSPAEGRRPTQQDRGGDQQPGSREQQPDRKREGKQQDRSGQGSQGSQGSQGRQDRQDNQGQKNNQGQGQNQGQNQGPGSNNRSDDGSNRRNRLRRGRDRTQGSRSRNEPDLNILEDDVLTPAAGILDVLENYA
ncbi:MAG: Rho termination factor N-terminal domain-containing protein, partial [Marmoricola sp.]